MTNPTPPPQNLPAQAIQRWRSDIEHFIMQNKSDLMAVMSPVIAKVMTPERITSLLVYAANQNLDITKCSPTSVYQCIRASAQLGLEPGPLLGHMHLVPFGNVLTPIVGHRGYRLLAERTGRYSRVASNPVYAKDVVEWEEGTSPKFIHRPHLGADRGELVGAYCLTVLKESGDFTVTFLNAEDIAQIRKMSRSASTANSPWNTFTASMWMKCAQKRHFKNEPLDPTSDLIKAIVLDDEVETKGGDANITPSPEITVPTSKGSKGDGLAAKVRAKQSAQVEDANVVSETPAADVPHETSEPTTPESPAEEPVEPAPDNDPNHDETNGEALCNSLRTLFDQWKIPPGDQEQWMTDMSDDVGTWEEAVKNPEAVRDLIIMLNNYFAVYQAAKRVLPKGSKAFAPLLDKWSGGKVTTFPALRKMPKIIKPTLDAALKETDNQGELVS